MNIYADNACVCTICISFRIDITDVILTYVDWQLATLLGLIPSSFVYVYAGAVGKDVANGEAGGWSDYITYAVGLVATVAVTIKVVKVAQEALDNAVDDKGETGGSDSVSTPGAEKLRRSARLQSQQQK